MTRVDPSISSSMRRDIASAYVATGARLGAWIIVLGLVYQVLGEEAAALVALVRGTLAILNYTSLGLAPALVHLLAKQRARPAVNQPPEDAAGGVLPYATAALSPDTVTRLHTLYATALTLLLWLAIAGCILLLLLVEPFAHWLRNDDTLPAATGALVLSFGVGILARLISDAPGAVLQTAHRITTDNLLLAAAEIAWVGLSVLFLTGIAPSVQYVGLAFVAANVALLLARLAFASLHVPLLKGRFHPDWRAMRQMLAFGLAVAVAQAADYLYAPIDYILIKQFIELRAVSVYFPAVQIDAGLLVLVSAIAAVLFPKGALAHAAGDVAALRRYYVRGTLASLAILIPASIVIWFASPLIFRAWFGNDMPETRAILWLMLINACIGGSAMVGRSILLAMGQVRAFTASVLAAGVLNVVLSYLFVRYLGLGLYGIVLGTVAAVTLRCALWMPWYVLREIARNDPSTPPILPTAPPSATGY